MYNQWRSQDTEVALAQGLHAAEGSAHGIEARSADHSARSAGKKFRLHFSVTRMGSRGTFVLRTASNPCLVRLAGESGTVIRLKL